MANLRLINISTAITTVTDAAVMVTDNSAGTNKVEKITYANLETQIRNGASDADLAKLIAVTSSSAELNILDGVTADKDELNILDGVTADKDEINVLAGFSGSAADVERLAEVDSALMGKDENQAVNVAYVTGSLSITGGSGNYEFTTDSATIDATMPEINKLKSEEIMCKFVADGGYDVNILRFAGDAGFMKADGTTTGTRITFSDADDFVYLKSSSVTNGYWMILGGTGYTLA